jgi:hypothetical protein
MEYKTIVDSIGIRIECKSALEQRELLERLLNDIRISTTFIINYKDHIINDVTGAFIREYFIYSHHKTLASISTNSYTTGKYRNDTVFYIKIVWAGLKRYNDHTDKLSLFCMMNICSWLYSRGHVLKLSELDIALDFECQFPHILALCIKRQPNVKYYKPDDIQMYDGETAWVENINLKRKKHVKLLAQVYDKQLKEQLEDKVVTRFECAMKTPYFNNKSNNFDELLKSIAGTLDRYAVLYFQDLNIKQSVGQQYINIIDSNIQNKSRKLKSMNLDAYRAYPDMNYITKFLETILFTKDFHTNVKEQWFVDAILSKLANE